MEKSWDVRVVDLPSSSRPILLEITGTKQDIAVKHGYGEAGVEKHLGAEEAFTLGLALIQKAAQVGVTVREKN